MLAEAVAAQPVCPRTSLPRSGMHLSRLGLGLSRLHYLSREEGIRLVHAALDLGVTHFDTARLYGDGFSETVLGLALQGRRGDAAIATKFGLLPGPLVEKAGPLAHPLRGVRSVLRRTGVLGGPRRSWTVATLRSALEASLRSLRTDRIDILMLHEPRAEELAGADDLFAELDRLRRTGAVGAVGVATSGDEAPRIVDRHGAFIDVVQAPETEWREPLLEPDITFGAISVGPQVFGGAKPGREAVCESLARALQRRQRGTVLVGTTRPAHLAELVSISSDVAR